MATMSDTEASPLLSRPPKISNRRLGAIQGCFIPTVSNIISVLVFLKFPYIVGEAGYFISIAMLLVSYAINLLSTFSICAIVSNGQIEGGGLYFLVSRTLGFELGASIGLVFYFGQLLNAGMSINGLVEALLAVHNRGDQVSKSIVFVIRSAIAVLCASLAILDPRILNYTSSLIICVLAISLASIPLSVIIKPSFDDLLMHYTGPSFETLKQNFWPYHSFTNYSHVFGILYPTTIGFWAGTSLSGDLKAPSKSIPKGTLSALVFTFITYFFIMSSNAISIDRKSLLNNPKAIDQANVISFLPFLGSLTSAFSSAVFGIIGSSKVLEAMTKDRIFSLAKVSRLNLNFPNTTFSSVLITLIFTELTFFFNIDALATMITMTFLLTFAIINFSCFMLRIASTPNFRPTFRSYNVYTTSFGFLLCLSLMLFVNPTVALLSLLVSIVLLFFFNITLQSDSRPFSDLFKTFIGLHIRKYLLRLDKAEVRDIRYWKPKLLLLVDDPDRSLGIALFCNALRKSSLFVISSIVSDPEFDIVMQKYSKKRKQLERFVIENELKAFVDVAMSDSFSSGARSIISLSGLGSFRPNISIMGFYKQQDRTNSAESKLSIQDWMKALEDFLNGFTHVMICKGFDRNFTFTNDDPNRKIQTIDLWPMDLTDGALSKCESTITNFDTYTMILQCGQILHTVKQWKLFRLRVFIIIENPEFLEEEESQARLLLDELRIDAELIMVIMNESENTYYAALTKGDYQNELDELLESKLGEWWQKHKLGFKKELNQESIKNGPMSNMTKEEASSSSAMSNYNSGTDVNEKILPNQNLREHITISKPTINNLAFFNLPSLAQSLIINEIIKMQQIKFKNAAKTAITLTTLSRPSRNTYTDVKLCEEWLNEISVMTKDIGPVAMIHSREMTVTRSL